MTYTVQKYFFVRIDVIMDKILVGNHVSNIYTMVNYILVNRLGTESINPTQKQLSTGALRKRCPENMLQIYRRTLMSKCDSIKLTSNVIEITLWRRCFPINLQHVFRINFYKNTYGGLLLPTEDICQSTRGVRTLSNIYDGSYCAKIAKR